jgi:hypothetical protein
MEGAPKGDKAKEYMLKSFARIAYALLYWVLYYFYENQASIE